MIRETQTISNHYGSLIEHMYSGSGELKLDGIEITGFFLIFQLFF